MNKELIFAAGLCLLTAPALGQAWLVDARQKANAEYNPIINAAEFSPVITNKYYTLAPGMKAAYEMETSKGPRVNQIDVDGETRLVMGVATLVVRNREWLNDRLIEDTKEWVAQDKSGNVWYFGESVEYYRDGKLAKNDGAWEAGVDGAKPGVLMFGEPKAGTTYRREYRPGKGEDMGTVVAVGMSMSIPQGPHFQNCVHIREWSPLNRGDVEHKYFCVGLGAMVLKEERADRLTLVGFKKSLEAPPQLWRTASLR